MIRLPLEPLLILHGLTSARFDGYIVGGAVRDLLSSDSLDVSDYDFTTNATPEEILKIFPEGFYKNDFGTVSVTQAELLSQYRAEQYLPPQETQSSPQIDIAGSTKVHPALQEQPIEKIKQERQSVVYEITTYRTGEVYPDHSRKPNVLSWGQDIKEDLSRRDFTINALALRLQPAYLQKLSTLKQQYWHSFEISQLDIIDNHDGLTDLKNKLIKTVGDPSSRFKEDPLRMLRAVRLQAQLSFELDSNLTAALAQQSQELAYVSQERIRDELFKILLSAQPKKAIQQLDAAGLLTFVLPELLPAKGVEQGGHHTTDVWTHSLDALQNSPSSDPIVRLATLLHDVGKPATYKVVDGKPTFYNHEVVGAHMAKKIGRRLHLSKDEINKLFILVRHHMFHYQPENTDAAIRRFMKRVGLEYLNDILDLREADRLGSGARKTSWRLEEMKERIRQQLHQPFSISDLAVSGTTLMEEFRVEPGPHIGKALQKLFEHVLESPADNTPEKLISLVRKNNWL